MSNAGTTLWTLVYINHVLDETKLTKSMLASCCYRMCDKIITNFTKYCNTINMFSLMFDLLLFLLCVLFLFFIIFILIFLKWNFFFMRVLWLFWLLMIRILDCFNKDGSVDGLFVGLAHFRYLYVFIIIFWTKFIYNTLYLKNLCINSSILIVI